VSEIDSQEDRDADICSEERGSAPKGRPKHVEAIDECENGEGDDANVRAPWLQYGLVWKVGYTLGDAGFAEAEIDYAAADPGDEAGRVC